MGSKKSRSRQKVEPALIKGKSNQEILDHLQALAEKDNITIRFEKGDFKSGSCRIEDQNIIILKKDDTVANQVDNLLSELFLKKAAPVELYPELQKRLDTLKSMAE